MANSNNEIDIYGVLNSATVDGIIAKAEQIKLTLPVGDDTTVSDYVSSNMQAKSGEYIANYIDAKPKVSALFFCISDSGNFTKAHIYYYSGETQIYEDLTPEGTGSGSGGSGLSARPVLTVQTTIKSEYAIGDKISIDYYWTSDMNIGYGRTHFFLDGTELLSRRELPNNALTTDAVRTWSLPTLSRGSHKIEMYVTDSGSISSSPRYTAEFVMGGLELSSSFDQNSYYAANTDLRIGYTLYNSSSLEATVYVQYDDNEVFISESTPIRLTGAIVTEGEHKVKIWAETTEKTSNTLELSFVVAEANKVYVLSSGTSHQDSDHSDDNTYASIESGQQLSTYLRVIEIDGSTFNVGISLINTDETFTEIGEEKTLANVKWALGPNTYIASYEVGYYFLKFTVTSTVTGASAELIFKITIKESSLYTVDAIRDGLILELLADGKSNQGDDKAEWLDTSGNNVQVHMNDFNYATNGWMTDTVNDIQETYLLVNSRAYVEIDLEPFYTSSTVNELTVDIQFETRDISNELARVISCYQGSTGFFINTDTARLGSSVSKSAVEYTYKDYTTEDGETYTNTTKTGPFEVNFRQSNKTHITFTIYRNSEHSVYPIDVMAIYIDGVLTGIQSISSLDIFRLNKGAKIYIGCNPKEDDEETFENFGECKIYNLRIYDRALTYEEIVTNYVADITDPETRDTKVKANKLGKAAGNTELVIPEMTFTMFEDDYKGMSKANKKPSIISYQSNNSTVADINGDYAITAWQGTSTLAYAVKNFKIKLYSPTDYSKLEADGITEDQAATLFKDVTNLKKYGKKDKINIGNGMVENVFTLKADYMDSSSARNTATAMFIPSMGTEETPIQQYIPACRTQIYGFPIRLKLNLVPGNHDGIPDESLATTSTLGIYNFNLDKDCTDSIGLYEKDDVYDYLKTNNQETEMNDFLEKYPYWDSMSFEIAANSDNSAGAFARYDFDSINTDFEFRFPEEDDITGIDYYGTYTVDKSTNKINISITHKYKLGKFGDRQDEELDASNLPGVYQEIGLTKYVSNNLITGVYTMNDDMSELSNAQWTMKKTYNKEKQRYDYVIEDYNDISGSTVTTGPLNITFINKDLTAFGIDENGGHIVFTETGSQQYMNSRVHLQRLIKWVYDADDTTFRADFEKHFNFSAVLDYFLLVLVNGMADNLGKNMMLDTYGPGVVGRRYTVDKTSVITYTDAEIAEYDNYIWYPHFYDMDTQLSVDNSGNVRFDTDIEISQGVFNTSNSRLWTKFQRVFATEIKKRYEELRNNGTFTIDNYWKYYYTNQIALVPEMDYNDSFFNKYLATEDRRQYMFMMHGNQAEMLHRWIEQRLYFMDTYFELGSEYNSQCTVRVEYADFATEPVTYNISTYIPSYVKVIFKNSGDNDESSNMVVRKKVGRGETVEFSKFITTSTDQETIIYNAKNLKSFGDVSKYTPKTVLIADAEKLTTLSVGTEEYPNPNLTNLALGKNTYLTDIIVENCTSMASALDVSGCTNLERISTLGSSILSVVFPQGAPLKEAYLSSYTTSLAMSDLAIIDTLTIADTSKLTNISISNCPKLMGYIDEDGNIVEGPFWNTILSSYVPTNSLTTLNFEGYGYVNNYNFLDAAATLANKYPENFNISGEVRYIGSTIPQMYSYYNIDFPNLTVKYPNVNNVSSMFDHYKNINAVFTRQEVVGTDDDARTETFYYWTDLAEDRGFSSDAYTTYKGVKARKLAYYDEVDAKLLADEIKERLAPFEKFTNVNSMFNSLTTLEYLHDDTFDNIDLSSASTAFMFQDCAALRYFEVPGNKRKADGTIIGGMSTLGNYMFSNCNKAVVYIPTSVTNIDDTAFYASNMDEGNHQMTLFESTTNYDDHKAIRDGRYGVVKAPDTTDENGNIVRGHALRTKTVQYTDLITTTTIPTSKEHTLYIDYFQTDDDDKILVQKVYEDEDDSEVQICSFNISIDPSKYTSSEFTSFGSTGFSNPLNVGEFLPGSLRLLSRSYLRSLGTPSYMIKPINSADTYPLKTYDTTIARMFDYDVIIDEDRTLIGNGNTLDIYLLPTHSKHRNSVDGPKVSRWFLQHTNPKAVYISPEILFIESGAFEYCSAPTISFQRSWSDSAKEYVSKVRRIDDTAFKNSGITKIDVPNSVSNTAYTNEVGGGGLGESVFENCQNVQSLSYSENMTMIPAKCFASVLKNATSTMSSITGFSKNITYIGDNAFDSAANLGLFRPRTGVVGDLDSGDQTGFDCEFVCATEGSGENINYFTNIQSIGSSAFKGIYNITKVTVPSTLRYIGSSAFVPPTSSDGSVENTLLEWEADGDYSGLTIGSSAFMNRQLNWLNNRSGFDTDEFENDKAKVITKAVYIPNVGVIEADAFSPYVGTATKAELDFVLCDSSEDYANNNWHTGYVNNASEKIYNFKNALHSDRMLYILNEKNDEKRALAARLLSSDTGMVKINKSIIFEDEEYRITEVLNKAFNISNTSLYSITFSEDCELMRLGDSLFSHKGINNINVVDSTNDYVKDSDGNYVFIPATIVKSEEFPDPIGSNNPFKSTAWFTSQFNGIYDDFVYLNEYCIGYEPPEGASSTDKTSIITTESRIREGTKFIYESAFSNESIKEIEFPSTLTKIMKSAFLGCSALNKLDFSPCSDNLTYIGSEAFKGTTSLTTLEYTPNVAYVGTDAFSNCINLNTVIFPEGMSVSSDSEPVSPLPDSTGYNTTITRFVISESMGDFYSPTGSGFTMFSRMSNIKDLVLGGVRYEFTDLPSIESVETELAAQGLSADEITAKIQSEYYGNGDFYVDFSTLEFEEDGVTYNLSDAYPLASYSGTPLKLRTAKNYFIVPYTRYNSSINVAKVKDYEYTQADILTMLLGFDNKKINSFIANRAAITKIMWSGFISARDGRIQPIVQE